MNQSKLDPRVLATASIESVTCVPGESNAILTVVVAVTRLSTESIERVWVRYGDTTAEADPTTAQVNKQSLNSVTEGYQLTAEVSCDETYDIEAWAQINTETNHDTDSVPCGACEGGEP